jgi:hypothetical protein
MTEAAPKKERIYRTAFPDQPLHEIEDEIWKPVVYHGAVVEKYFVSNYGNIIGPQNKKLKWVDRQGYPSISLMLPKTFAGYEYDSAAKGNRRRLSVGVHILVANAFLPLSDKQFLPESLKEEIQVGGVKASFWDICPESIKAFIRSCLHVDHIDANPCNPKLSNLRYVSPRENNHYIKKAQLDNESSNK